VQTFTLASGLQDNLVRLWLYTEECFVKYTKCEFKCTRHIWYVSPKHLFIS